MGERVLLLDHYCAVAPNLSLPRALIVLRGKWATNTRFSNAENVLDVDIPEEFRRLTVFKLDGRAESWLNSLNHIVDQCRQQWHLTIGPPLGFGTAALVLDCRREDDSHVALKLTTPESLRVELAVLNHWAGTKHVTPILEADISLGALLMPRMPRLADFEDLDLDKKRTIFVTLLQALHKHRLPPDHQSLGIRTALDRHLGRLSHFPHLEKSSDHRVPRYAARRSISLAQALSKSSDPEQQTLLYGDLKSDHIFLGPADHWVAIDPSPLWGEKEMDAALCAVKTAKTFSQQSVEGRAEELARKLDLNIERTVAWAQIEAFSRLHSRTLKQRSLPEREQLQQAVAIFSS